MFIYIIPMIKEGKPKQGYHKNIERPPMKQ